MSNFVSFTNSVQFTFKWFSGFPFLLWLKSQHVGNKGELWLEENQCQRRNNCFKTNTRGKGEHVLRGFYSLRKIQIGVGGNKKGAGPPLGMVFASVFLRSEQQNQLYQARRKSIGGTTGGPWGNQRGERGSFFLTKRQDPGHYQESSTAMTEHQPFSLCLCNMAFKIQSPSKKIKLFYEPLFYLWRGQGRALLFKRLLVLPKGKEWCCVEGKVTNTHFILSPAQLSSWPGPELPFPEASRRDQGRCWTCSASPLCRDLRSPQHPVSLSPSHGCVGSVE